MGNSHALDVTAMTRLFRSCLAWFHAAVAYTLKMKRRVGIRFLFALGVAVLVGAGGQAVGAGPAAPVGNFQGLPSDAGLGQYYSWGWTCDPDDYTAALRVDFYVDGTYAAGTYEGSATASVTRTDLGTLCGGYYNHGWQYYVPLDARWQVGAHTLYAYGINDNGVGPNTLLGTQSFTYYSISGNAGTAGATVTAGPRSATADASGNYTIYSVLQGTYTLTAAKTGCTFSSQSVTVGPNATGKNFTANCGPTTYTISGSAGVAGATVTAGSASATSDTNSNYTLTGLAQGTYTLTAAKSGCTFTPTSLSVTVGPNATGKNFTATCSGVNGASFTTQSVPAAMTAGQVYAASVTFQNSGTSTWTYSGNYRLGSQNPQDNTTWGANRVSLNAGETVAPGASRTFNFNVTAPAAAGNYNFQWQMVQDGVAWFGTTSTNVAVSVTSASYSISGNVGVAGATVTAGSASATSDASSNYTLPGLVAGTYTVTPSKAGCTFTPTSQSVTVGPNATGKNFTASCTGGATPVGSFQGLPSDASLGQFFAWGWTCESDNYSAALRVDFYVDGTFATGTYVGSVTANVTRTDLGTLCGSTNNHGWQYYLPLDARWQVGTHTLNAYAINANGVGPNALLGTQSFTYYSISGNGGTAGAAVTATPRSATADASGNYTIYSVLQGTYTVTATKAGCTFTPISQSVTVGPNATGKNFTATCSGVNGASFTTQSVPAAITAGQVYAASVTFQNSGTSTWTYSGNYRLGSQNPQDNTTWGTNRVSLNAGETVAPGASRTFSFNVTAPAAAGNYNFQWQMVQDGVAWFGTTSTNVVVTVTGATYSISGSAGVAGATVTAGSASATSDTNSNYTLTGLAQGTYAVTATKAGCTFTPTSQSVTVGPNATGKNFTATCSTAWSGPTVTLVPDGDLMKVRICPNSGPCTQGAPLFLGLNTELPNIWGTIDYQLGKFDTYMSALPNAVPFLKVHVNQSTLPTLITHLKQMAHPPYLLVQWYILGDANGPTFVGANLGGGTSPEPNLDEITPSWLSAARAEIQSTLGYLDQNYPGKVMGFTPMILTSGEGFMQPLDGAGNEAGVTWLPWDPQGMNQFYYPDVSGTATTEFCNWSGLPASLVAGCRSPTLLERNGGSTNSSSFLDPSQANYLRAAYFSQHQAVRIANAISTLAMYAKQFTGGKIMTAGIYGYMFGREWNLPSSGHTALSVLLGSPYIDALVGPYSYTDARNLGQPFVGQGVAGSPALSTKLWIHEDDTRTHLAADDIFKKVHTLTETNRILRRDTMTAALTGNGLYWFDLGGGWLGKPGFDADANSMWTSLADTVTQATKISTTVTNAYTPQIAVFVDDLTPSYMPVINPGGINTYSYASLLYSGALNTLQQLGAPVRVYRLDDIQKSNFPASSVKMAVFLNAFNVSTANRSAIASKLKVAGKTLVFLGAAGYLQGDGAPSVANMQGLTGIMTVAGVGSKVSDAVAESITGGSYGPAYPVSPWFDFQNGTVLGGYVDGNQTALVQRDFFVTGGSYRVVDSAVPGLSRALYRRFAADRGVTFFAPEGDAVEARGNTLMVHAAQAGQRTITLPFTVSQLWINSLLGETSACSNCSQTTRVFELGETVFYRWQ